MGFKISWLAFEALDKATLLDALGFHDTGASDEANEAPFSAAQLPNGWSIIWSNDFGWIETQSVKLPFPTKRTIACQLHEGLMFSAAHGAKDGIEMWSLSHDAQTDLHNLSMTGDLPATFPAIRDRLFEEQKAEDAGSAEVDFIFDIPIELAQSVTGFRHDLWEMDGRRPNWSVIEPKSPPRPQHSFFKWPFKRKGESR
ncbi:MULTISPECIES: hypothetical protein [Sphingobium]|uniref:Uncharacterized protein n=1 Tax=Sphingobium yanoikuyae ATCC 51230 TaxID=883163 RepID=K9DDX2_SPHYA|nr:MULTISPECIES: hypothetical protein [Sphingobium]EKU75730.1 hypothetical protein HMPREF9718_01082 [Sphingobium yanoikuyae ATCC 51230]WQE05516.1 hypothetical protein U0025_14455 [Sphingobium yanoikuyae]SHL84330.1 hypothetical protein SAMN05518668_103387 [Sphingobium sp. YR657]